MAPATVELFYGILALVALAAIAALVALRAAAALVPIAGTAHGAVARAVGPQAFGLATGVAALATAGSLYFSEVAGFEPCTLCWYQRIAMYPLVVVLGVGTLARDGSAIVAGRILAGIGAVIAAYHVLLEWVPSLDGGACDPTNPCTLVWFRTFGFISLPTLALIAFLLILTLLALRPSPDDGPDHTGAAA